MQKLLTLQKPQKWDGCSSKGELNRGPNQCLREYIAQLGDVAGENSLTPVS